jgi:predicted O-methyltransferase YrrM
MKEIEKNNNRISTIEHHQIRLDRRSEDILAMAYLQPLINSYLPFTNSSLRPYNIACILNDIIINQRNVILEFGSGISTILIGRLIKQHELNAEITSVEHDKGWMDVIQKTIKKENLNGVIKLVYAPLRPNKQSNNEWYDEVNLKEITTKCYDMVVIDGPPAWEKYKEEARFPALPFIINHLNENSVLYLDDANREGEQKIIRQWEENYNIKFNFMGTLAYFNKGRFFNPAIR